MATIKTSLKLFVTAPITVVATTGWGVIKQTAAAADSTDNATVRYLLDTSHRGLKSDGLARGARYADYAGDKISSATAATGEFFGDLFADDTPAPRSTSGYSGFGRK